MATYEEIQENIKKAQQLGPTVEAAETDPETVYKERNPEDFHTFKPGFNRPFAYGLGQAYSEGALLGGGGEATSLLQGDERGKQWDAVQTAFAAENPIWDAGAKVAGGIMSAGLPGLLLSALRGTKALKTTKEAIDLMKKQKADPGVQTKAAAKYLAQPLDEQLRYLPTIGKTTATGAAEGALSGALTAEEGKRMEAAITGSLTDAGITNAAQHAKRLVVGIARMMGGNYRSAKDVEGDVVFKMYEAANGGRGMNAEQAYKRLQELREVSPQATLMDALGRGSFDQVSEMKALDPKIGALLEEQFRDRARKRGPRIATFINRMFNRDPKTGGRVFAEDEAARVKRETDASPLYDRAITPDKVVNQEFNDLYRKLRALSPDIFRRPEGAEASEYLPAIYKDPRWKPQRPGVKRAKYRKNEIIPLSTEFMFETKRALDDKISTLYRAGKNAEAKKLAKIRDEVDDALANANKDYEKARDMWAGTKAEDRGRQFGLDAMNQRDPEVAMAWLQTATPNEQRAFVTGVYDHVLDRFNRMQPDDVDVNVFNSPHEIEVFQTAMEATGMSEAQAKQAVKRFQDMMEKERLFAQGENVQFGKSVAPDLEVKNQGVSGVTVPSFATLGLRKAQVDRANAAKRRVVDALVERGDDEAGRVLDAARQKRARQQLRSDLTSATAASIANYLRGKGESKEKVHEYMDTLERRARASAYDAGDLRKTHENLRRGYELREKRRREREKNKK